RRFIPKGDYIHNYSLQQIINIAPDEIFERELDRIYQTA
ncbi:MAG: IS30 family transposase, partial [Lactobacillus crispatus]